MSRKTDARARLRAQDAKKRKRRLCAVLAALLLGAAALALDSYPAGSDAMDAMKTARTKGNVTIFEAENPRAGLIFYPGALVEHEAYAPLMREIASRGVSCLLAEMPLNLAVLDQDAAKGLSAELPQVDTWLIGGHSLGGAMAAAYASEHPQDFDALVLLGAYSAADLSGTQLKVLSVVGSEDGVLSREKYEACRGNYPPSFEEFVIEGGCHAYFGDYGAQRGDGTPTISRQLQTGMTASAIAALVP